MVPFLAPPRLLRRQGEGGSHHAGPVQRDALRAVLDYLPMHPQGGKLRFRPDPISYILVWDHLLDVRELGEESLGSG